MLIVGESNGLRYGGALRHGGRTLRHGGTQTLRMRRLSYVCNARWLAMSCCNEYNEDASLYRD